MLATAGPFGLEMGMTPEQLRQAGVDLKPQKNGWFEARKLPKTLDAFEAYELWVEPGIGLCKLRAIGRTITSNSFGDQLKAEFDTIEQLLVGAYGQNIRFDFLRNGSIWSDRNDWMMALLKKERTLTSFWDKSEGSTMKDRVSAIALYANGMNVSRGYIDVRYEFENVDSCIEKSKSRRSGTP